MRPLCILTDIEDAVIVPPGVAIMGITTGNMMCVAPRHMCIGILTSLLICSHLASRGKSIIVYELVKTNIRNGYSAFILFQRRAIFTVGLKELRDNTKPKIVILK